MANFKKPNFPFTILDVINALGLSIRKAHNNELYIDCPNCVPNKTNGHNGVGKCQVLVYEGVYSCQRCGEFHGGILDLYCYYRNVDKSTANREMRRYVNAPVYKQKKEQIQKIVKSAAATVGATCDLASRIDIDKTYRAFISLCGLADAHKNNLLTRGLSEKNIAHYGFKTTPATIEERNRITQELLRRNCKLQGVPGFYVNHNGDWDFNINSGMKGFIVPMCNLQNQVLGFQIRLDNPIEQRKYIWFSSKNKNQGTGRTSVPHITNTSKISESVYITEGGLKADVAHVLSNRTFVSLAGVTQFKVLPLLFAQLKKNGVKRIIDSFDVDCKYNENVEKARQKLKQYVLKAGLEYFRMEWDERYKGIDDYLLAHPRGTREFIVYDK